MANGSIAQSTHTAMLPHEHLPKNTRKGHVIATLTTPLLSIGKFCDAGFQAIFDSTTVTITDPTTNTSLLKGHRTDNGLWKL